MEEGHDGEISSFNCEVWFKNMEGFITDTTNSHQGAVQIFWLHLASSHGSHGVHLLQTKAKEVNANVGGDRL